ncbi:MAG: alpha/beta hydrolase fold domain-containing protein [Rhodobacter sp.]|nr:alpha/beta hydrolase fold domain-containing protein [Rhodobacter sp.]
MSLALGLIRGVMRGTVKPFFGVVRSVLVLRASLVLASVLFPLPFGVTVRRARLGPRDAVWFTRAGEDSAGPILFWLHGGAHFSGSAFTHRGMLGRLALACDCAVVVPEFRRAPEHPLPAALEDAVAAFDALCASGVRPDRVVLGGDSSGGGLALALLARLEAEGRRVAGLVLLSPWLDMTLSGASIRDNAGSDPLIPLVRIVEAVELVRGAEPVDGPVASPLFAPFRAACPALVTVGTTELLLDDSRRLAARWRDLGGRLDLVCLPGAPHVLAFLAPWVPESRAEIRRIAGFVRDCLAAQLVLTVSR